VPHAAQREVWNDIFGHETIRATVAPTAPAWSAEYQLQLRPHVTRHLATIKVRDLTRFILFETGLYLEHDESGFWHIDAPRPQCALGRGYF
jgi:hypothetical protein